MLFYAYKLSNGRFLNETMCMGLVACGSSGNDAQTTKGEETTTAEVSGESDLSGRKAILIVNGNLGEVFVK